ncbi:hypothetical protein Q5P01_006623 [Channa striata]|uniref:Ig-like domain-containing protein n=1 Tax=Channa striata TaxID=64152 RepID=A0AA88N960_CHASR|nr:hypothetical protein Q5P01_006623 [Channa striata]
MIQKGNHDLAEYPSSISQDSEIKKKLPEVKVQGSRAAAGCENVTEAFSRHPGTRSSDGNCSRIMEKGQGGVSPAASNSDEYEWTTWFNVDHPGGHGDYEQLEAIRFYYRARVCETPRAIEARTTEWVPARETGEVVHADPTVGFWCLNEEQGPERNCSNYAVRFLCPKDNSVSIEGIWGPWSDWSSCPALCGQVGVQLRTRNCQSPSVPCTGSKVEAKPCKGPECRKTECSLQCVMGKVNAECDTCMCEEHVLLGSVRGAGGLTAEGAAVLRHNKLLTLTDHNGHFRVPGICPDGNTTLTVTLQGHATLKATVPNSSQRTSVLSLQMKRIEKLHVLSHPESKARRVGQTAAFCCKVAGTPQAEKYQWFHNESLLEGQSESTLVLKDVQAGQAGEYHCRASGPSGTIKSKPATLKILGKDEHSCNPKPESHFIRLPHDCYQNSTDSFYYDVGRCPSSTCAGQLDNGIRCKDKVLYCCGVENMEERQITCQGYELPTMVVTECGCQKCVDTKAVVYGRAIAADSGEPLRYFHFNTKGGSVYHEVKLLRKKAPVTISPTETNILELGEVEGQEAMVQIQIPPHSFYKENGEVFTGNVNASVTFLDPRDVSTAAAAQSDLNFVGDEGDTLPLRTYGMFSVDFRGEENNEPLNAGEVKVFLDSAQVQMPEHLNTIKLWSLNPDTGLWEEEGILQMEKKKRGKREERTFLIGNMEIRERRLFNLDVPENRRCYVKVRAFRSERYMPSEQVEGVVVSLINMEPTPGYSTNPRAWGRFDSVVTGSNGACIPAFCDEQKTDAYSAYVMANLGGEELETVPSLPNSIPTSLECPNLTWECEEAPFSAAHFRFSRVEGDRYDYNTVPFNEDDPMSWTEDYLNWWPKPMEYRACYIKVKLSGPHELNVRSRNMGGTHPKTVGQLYGLRDTRSIRDMDQTNVSAVCVEFKCSGMLYDQERVDRTLVKVIPQGSCKRDHVNAKLQEYLVNHLPLAVNNDTNEFTMLAPLDPLGHNYGIYTVTDQDPRTAKEIALGRCFDGSSDGTSRVMKSNEGVALTFTCGDNEANRQSVFQALQNTQGQMVTSVVRGEGRQNRRRQRANALRSSRRRSTRNPTGKRSKGTS